jgi:transglutaminase-like putative cysteine protease
MPKKWNQLYFFRVLCAFLCSAGIMMFLVDYMSFSHDLTMLTVCALCAVAIILLVILTSHRYVTIAFLGGTALCVLYYYFFQLQEMYLFFGYLEKFARWIIPFYKETTHTNPPYESLLLILLTTAVCLLLFLVTCVFRSALLTFLLTMTPVIFLGISSTKALPVYFLIPCIFGIIFYLSSTAKIDLQLTEKENTPDTIPRGYWQTVFGMIPVIIASIILMQILSTVVPPSNFKSQDTTDTTNDILSFFDIPLANKKNQQLFSLSNIGFYPSRTVLGGTPTLSDDRMLSVVTAYNVLLRANMYEIYDMTSWSSTSNFFTSRLNSSLAKNRTEDVFDMNRPDRSKIPANLYDYVFQKVTISVTYFNRDIGVTVFSADHLLDISKESNRVYYNEDEELFFGNDIKYKETYSITYNRFRTESPDFYKNMLSLEAYIIEHPEAQDSKSKMKSISDEFLPVTVPDSVKEFALLATESETTPLGKVFALKRILGNEFEYSLIVDDPPTDSDFVEHFLETKKGYCTYFASAMTVMARVNGIPARYVDGFSTQVPSGNKYPIEVMLTGRQGHAWCEVYIDGIGWIPIDATPGYNTEEVLVTNEDPEIPTGDFDFEFDFEKDDPNNVPDQNDGTQNDADRANGFQKFIDWVGTKGNAVLLPLMLYAVLFTSLFIAMALRRWNRTFVIGPLPEYADDTESGRQKRLVKYWEQTLGHLSLLSVQIAPEESVADFADRMREIDIHIAGCGKDTYRFQIKQIAFLYEKWIYGNIPPTQEELVLAHEELSVIISQVRKAHTTPGFYVIHFLVWTK